MSKKENKFLGEFWKETELMSWSSSRWQQQVLLFLTRGDVCLEDKSEFRSCLISDMGIERARSRLKQLRYHGFACTSFYSVTDAGQFIKAGCYICVIPSCLYF